MKHTTIDISELPDGALELLQRLAEQRGRTANDYVREAILEKLEDLEDLAAAEEVLLRRQKGETETYTLEEVTRKLGLDR